MTDTKMLEILVTDDSQANLEAAKSAFQGVEDVKFTYEPDHRKAVQGIEEGRYDGVISDLMYDATDPEVRSEKFKLIKKNAALIQKEDRRLRSDKEIYEEEEEKMLRARLETVSRDFYGPEFEKEGFLSDLEYPESPFGYYVAEACQGAEVPYVVMTSGHTAHGDASCPASFLLEEEGLVRGSHEHSTMEWFDNLVVTSLEEYMDKCDYQRVWEGYSREGRTSLSYDEWMAEGYNNLFTRPSLIDDADKKDPEYWNYALGLVRNQIAHREK